MVTTAGSLIPDLFHELEHYYAFRALELNKLKRMRVFGTLTLSLTSTRSKGLPPKPFVSLKWHQISLTGQRGHGSSSFTVTL